MYLDKCLLTVGRSLFIYEVVEYECMTIKVNEGY